MKTEKCLMTVCKECGATVAHAPRCSACGRFLHDFYELSLVMIQCELCKKWVPKDKYCNNCGFRQKDK